MIIDDKEVYPTSSESLSITCPKCGDEGRRHVWVNTVVRAVQIRELCYSCDYEKFEPWEVVEEEPRCACKGCNACDPVGHCARNPEPDVCTVCAVELIRTLDDKPPVHNFEKDTVKAGKKRAPRPWFQDLTHDELLRACGVFFCAGCDAYLGNKYVWQGKNRWCEKCFWGEDSEDVTNKAPVESGAPEKENADVDH